ncbi:MAG TPA: PH domain-containing protein [Homoserinimonas sp.]|nr:PH domain-containing protein [Homoserinimonas sp.]
MTHRLEVPELTWRRISPKFIVSELVGAVAFWGMAVGATLVLQSFGWEWAGWATATAVACFVISAAVTPRRVGSYGYQLREDDLVFRRGIMFQRMVAVPYGRMQLVDINRGPLSRALGLSELKFVTAAASTGITIPGLLARDAEDLRDHLVAVAESRRAGL